MNNEWAWREDLHCPLCLARALWYREAGVYYCVGCDRRLALSIYDTISLSASEQAELFFPKRRSVICGRIPLRDGIVRVDSCFGVAIHFRTQDTGLLRVIVSPVYHGRAV